MLIDDFYLFAFIIFPCVTLGALFGIFYTIWHLNKNGYLK